MKKAPLYSRSRRPPASSEGAVEAAPAAAAAGPARAGRFARLGAFASRHERRLWVLGLIALLAGFWFWNGKPRAPAPLSFEQIDHLVRKSIEEKPLPSAAARAYEKVIPSVVRVVGLANTREDVHGNRDDANPPERKDGARPDVKDADKDKAAKDKADKTAKGKDGARQAARDGTKDGARDADGKDKDKDATRDKDRPPATADANKDPPGLKERGIGTGVVIVDNGTILTNLHVVLGADKIRVTFHDGLEAEARLVSVMPEHDLAVLRALKIPDDLIPATMRSTGDLAPGDRVMPVGFPFGIGPSASEGVVSGLKREFRSPEGERVLTNLIQFDAAANPGNSGGPLVTMEGEVVGIVTAILNPTKQRVFVGIGFAVPIENAAAGAGLPPF